ncbi:MAG: hypothetical protein QXO25_06945, partial [Candidatus Bathyarchaeia archaeon]
ASGRLIRHSYYPRLVTSRTSSRSSCTRYLEGWWRRMQFAHCTRGEIVGPDARRLSALLLHI